MIDDKMSKNREIKREERPFNLFGIMLPSLPSLIVRLGGTFLRFKRDAKKAGKIFRKELIKQGFDKKTAAELTEIYLEGSNLTKIMFNSL
jgi:hypothetical protein